ncbi:uncharacterized protein [Dermacentor albipictus]|uniref:uncharacterized protein n=1 Tax=Dermacentor albipictus TaxID=60249 RepID=UPI0031FDE8D8
MCSRALPFVRSVRSLWDTSPLRAAFPVFSAGSRSPRAALADIPSILPGVVAQAKAIPRDPVHSDVSRLMRGIGLTCYRLQLADDVPVSVQRLLCTAIALRPYPDVRMIVLHEATWNMDPGSRRETWQPVAMALRYERAFLVPSDFADTQALTDHLHFQHYGKQHCVNTTQYIKTQFGKGYMNTQLRLSKGKGYPYPGVQDPIRKHSAFVDKVMDKSTSMQFQLISTSAMPSISTRDLFYKLDEAKSKQDVAKMGLMVATLEDVLQGWVASSGPLSMFTFVQMLKQLSPRGRRVNLFTEVQDQGVQPMAHEVGTHRFKISSLHVQLFLEVFVVIWVIWTIWVIWVFSVAVTVTSITSIKNWIIIIVFMVVLECRKHILRSLWSHWQFLGP